MANPAPGSSWAALYIAVVGALCLVPLRWRRSAQALRHQLRVVSVVRESPGAVSVLVTGQHLDELRAEPGQFFRWRFLTRGPVVGVATRTRCRRRRARDACASPSRISGTTARALARLQPGTRVIAEGPYGALTARRRTQRRVLLIAAGVGITPLRALFETHPAPGPAS